MQSLAEITLFSRLAAALSSALTPEDVIASVAEHSLSPLGARAGFVALLTDDGTELEIRRALGPDEQSLPVCRFPVAAQVPAGEAVRTRQAVFVESPAERAERYPTWTAGRWSQHGAWAAVPLTARDQMLGAMLLCFADAAPFDEARRGLIETVATMCGQALHRALLVHAAHEADRKKDEFLAILGHELRNPLAPIQTALELLKMRGRDDRELEVPIAVMERQVRHLSRLVDDLMDVSRITRGKIVLQKEAIEARQIVERAVEMAAPLFEHKSQHVRVIAPEEPVVLDGDPVRLAQVVANLLTNAAKYTPTAGHVTVTIDLSYGAALLSVRDDGIGIAPEMLSQLFELFVQGPRALDRSEGGLGIGLTLVRSLVELHGGTVEAKSGGPGTGSEFIVRLPLARTSAPQPSASAAVAATQKRVLLVDDNADAVDLIGELLGEFGYVIAVAYDGVEALKLAETLQPTVALLDIGLPVIDGYELAARLRATRPELRLIAITGYGQDADRRRSKRAGFAVHLTKPVTVKEIVAAIEGDAVKSGTS